MNVSNCIVCAEECDFDEISDEVSSKVNYTKFKVCLDCISKSDPLESFEEVKKIIAWYSDKKIADKLLKEARESNVMSNVQSADECSKK